MNGSKGVDDEIDLLTLLIEKWDDEHNSFMVVDPIKLLHSFMEELEMKAKDLVKLLNVSKGYISDILNYKKGLSRDNIIRNLSSHFKVSREAFNTPYKLKSQINAGMKHLFGICIRSVLDLYTDLPWIERSNGVFSAFLPGILRIYRPKIDSSDQIRCFYLNLCISFRIHDISS